MPGFRRLVVASIAALVLAGAPPLAHAAVTERITDGSFETSQCTAPDKTTCVNSYWTVDTSSSQRQNYFCTSVVCGGAASDGTDFLQLGGGTLSIQGTSTGFATQAVTIPADPATLTYRIKITAGAGTTSTMTVSMDGTPVKTESDATPTAEYATRTVPVSSYATPGSHTLTFALNCTGGSGQCGTFDIDQVSLTAESAAPTGPSAACLKATAKLKKAKAKLKKLKQDGASQQAIAKQKAKVKKKKAAKKKACAS